MSGIPPEHSAARALEQAFRDLGERRAPARQRSRPLRGASRVLIVAVAALLAAAVAAAGTKVFVGDGGTVSPDSSQGPSRLRQAPADRDLADVRAADPGSSIPWGMRVYRGARGDTCLVLGRVVSGHLGRVVNSRFGELPTTKPGYCDRLDRLHAMFSVRAYGEQIVAGRRAVLYGLVDRTIDDVHLRDNEGRDVPVPIAPDGSFIVARKGSNPFHLAHLVVDGSSGRKAYLLGT